MQDTNAEYWMAKALELAEQAASCGEVPVGAIVVCDGQIVGRGYNQSIGACDPTAHAEVMALRDAARRVDNYRLVDCDLYVTLEPCSMCAGAILHARIKHLYYGATEPKSGVVASRQQFFDLDFLNYAVEVTGGVLADKASQQLSDFFRMRREQKKALKHSSLGDSGL
ncbi:tRNA-specific adenosine deaminase [BD1-7 clade bacterium]|uniref:tRNA-specific adenosine deaminase n=1 Tax=BD1-7 clade bacterium TaxID=2029982 RepID=A0A5S9N1D7_9GAMM|nr:tRNA-specific adenosine deaminase [BD1-7 clade bacterium]